MSFAFAWPRSEPPQRIGSCEIHVWAWPLDSRSADPAKDTALLDSEELSRFHGFHFDCDRWRFATAHANMRRILGAYLGQAPNRIVFRANRFGKPELTNEGDSRTLRFNLSHSQNTALLALSLDTEVGIDIEEIRPIEAGVAQHHFSEMELKALGTLQGEEWLRGFYRCWTRKEAILKAEGVGLNLALDSFDVSLLPAARAELLRTRGSAGRLHPWKLHDLSAGGTTAAALAAGSGEAGIVCFNLAP